MVWNERQAVRPATIAPDQASCSTPSAASKSTVMLSPSPSVTEDP